MSEPEVAYCDNYDEIVGNTVASTVQVETKVVAAPETPEPEASDVQVETA